jgi:putative membrane protein
VSFGLTVPLADTWGMHGDVGAGWMIVMMFVMVLFWAAIILGIVWLARGAFDGWGGPRRETPTDILERRFAEGAISVEDYHERREVIGHATRLDKGAGPAPGA